jgi:hypothetical protein
MTTGRQVLASIAGIWKGNGFVFSYTHFFLFFCRHTQEEGQEKEFLHCEHLQDISELIDSP